MGLLSNLFSKTSDRQLLDNVEKTLDSMSKPNMSEEEKDYIHNTYLQATQHALNTGDYKKADVLSKKHINFLIK